MSLPVSLVVVAGGRSVRLGEDKRRLRLWGDDQPTLLEHTIRFLRQFGDDVVVVLNDPDDWTGLPARLVPDAYPDAGVLGGIWTGLDAARYDHALVVAGDMPFLNADLITWMLGRPRTYDVLVPRLQDGKARNRLGVESLHAVYGRSCRDPIRRQIEAGNPQIIGFFPEVTVELVEPETVARFDPDGRAFLNINRPDDLAAVRRIISGDAHV